MMVENHLVLDGMPAAWVLALVVFPLLLGIAAWAYRRPLLTPLLRRTLGGVRFLLLAGAVFMAFGPQLRRSETREEPAPLVVLLDDSASMERRDTLPSAEAEKLARELNLDGTHPRRLDILLGLLQTQWMQTLEEQYAVEKWRFSGRAVPAGPSLPEGRGVTTALGDALVEILAAYRGQRLPAVVAITDGRSHQGTSVAEAASRLAAEGVPVHVVALGDPRPAPDLALETLQRPEQVLLGEETLFLLKLKARNWPNPGPVDVRLVDENGRTLDQARVSAPNEDGVRFALAHRMETAGFRRLRAVVDPLEGETAREDNTVDLPVEVTARRVRVLYVEGRPRWEYRYLKNRLLRAEREIELRCWLADAGSGFVQEATPGSPPLQALPADSASLLDAFDVLILGDVDPGGLNPDPLFAPRFLDAVSGFVEEGGGLMMLAGPRHNPISFLSSPLEPLLPVVVGREGRRSPTTFRPLPADSEFPHPVVMLDPDSERNLSIWKEAVPMRWSFPVERLRPGARAWLVDPGRSNAHGPAIIAAGGPAPEGRVAWMGTDETWRWRFPGGEALPTRFWKSAIRWLAAGRIRSDQGKARLDLNRSRLEVGQALSVEARLGDPEILAEGGELEIRLENAAEGTRLDPVPGKPKLFRGVFIPTDPGAGRLLLTLSREPDGEPLASASFEAVLPSLEWEVASQDFEALSLLTRKTGGMLVDPTSAQSLLQVLDGSQKRRQTVSSRDEDLPPGWILGFFLSLATLEWLARRRRNLS